MILVTLGTQDKSFKRLLVAIDDLIEKKIIKDKVVVQAGCTKFDSQNMEIFDLIPYDKFDSYIKDCDLLITHGGVGSIITGLKKGKKVIACPRLKEFKEHTNNHQKEIIEILSKQGYILALDNPNDLENVLKKAKNFKPKSFKSNTNHMIKIVKDYINNN
ncbi:MAG: exopolysaccharide biosynthesis protein [Bacilli bacterium]|nr:exopolysaccharide biosynthesis protein [Bacilli bacterium]